MYAIFRTLGKQFKAEKGKTLRIPLMDAKPGATVTFDEVLLTSDGEQIKAGTPTVKGARVKAEVVGAVKGEKIVVFKYRPKNRYRVKTGHRQKLTRLKINAIRV